MEREPRHLETKCPHCGGLLHVDSETGEATKRVDPKSKSGRKMFDKAIEQVQERQKGMGKTFESAFSAVKDRGKDFDSKFDKALKGVDPDAPPPPNIFDFEDGKVAPRTLPDDNDDDDDDDDGDGDEDDR